ncbi:MAG: FISUMP domain-containing protein [Phaeodactylibacter sp.]|uniref:FISUMP domain-containing protein n=1 Tax=Phaeodactylibacter sp. TaxID=1940289 RepID=UPI0032EC94AB
MGNTKTYLPLFVLFFLVKSMSAQVTQTPWQYQEGKVVQFSTAKPADESVEDVLRKPFDEYKEDIPEKDNSGWKTAPVNSAGQTEYTFRKPVQCAKQVDFVYFQTIVNVPENVDIEKFTVSYQTANDAARIYFYNSKNDGTFDLKSDLIRRVSTNQKSDLRDKVVPGENRIVIVAYNQCAGGEVRGINIQVNGKSIEEVEAEVTKSHCGKEYEVVTIGDQTWLRKNLMEESCECDSLMKVDGSKGGKKGSPSPLYVNEPRFATYKNIPNYEVGTIYNYAAVIQCDLCPTGYRLPTKEDFDDLISSQGGTSQAGSKLRNGGSSGWNGGFDGRIDSYGSVLSGRIGFWMTSTPSPKKNHVWHFEIHQDGTVKLTEQDARTGAYVRCIKVDHSNPLGLEEIEEEEFTINAFSVNQGAGKGKWFIGYNNNDGNKTGRIVKDDNTAATITTVERINADPETYGEYTYAFKVKGENSYLVVNENSVNVFFETIESSDPKDLPARALFRNHPAFTKADGAEQFSSFESLYKPDHFLRHQGYILYVHTENNSELYKQDASWKLMKAE